MSSSFRTANSEDYKLENGQVSSHSRASSSDPSLYLDVSDPAFESFREEVSGAGDILAAMDHARRASSPTSSSALPTSSDTGVDEVKQKEGGERGEREERVVFIDNPGRTNERFEFSRNKVRTSKYTLLSFLPRNLFEQFHRVAYIYFLLIVILNQIPQLAVFGRLASLFPLLFVLVVTAIKDGYEDWGRHRSDRVENNRTSLVLQAGEFKAKKWKRIEAGEVVRISENESIPCDIVLLSTSDPNGVAYLQTINLDGETNLKTRYARQETASKGSSINGRVVCEPPNRNIYDFVAYLEVDGAQAPLGPNNIILRGCVLKNTSWIVGVVVYAGKETKAMMNSSGAQSKRSRLEQHMNKETLWLSAFLLIICIVGGIGMGKWIYDHEEELNSLPYYKEREISGKKYMYYGPTGEGVFAFLSFIIMFQIMIPISLYISMELVRLGQSYFMVRDVEMFHEPSNSRLQCRALNINEDLGQIQYIFSDKTGTLTDNKMEFHSASIGGVDYCSVLPPKLSRSDCLEEGNREPRLDLNLVDLLRSENEYSRAAHEYMLVLAACNTVIPNRHRSGRLEYQAESPDEQALVAAAAAYGYTLWERTSSTIVLDVLGEKQSYRVVGIHEFDSVRKRMSVVVECPDLTHKVLVKGADSALMGIVSRRAGAQDSSGVAGRMYSATQGHLDGYSKQGLRTLVVACKTLEQAEFELWHQQYKIASTALVDRVKLLREAAEVIESELVLLGATGIEDKLQEGVPETIASLRNSGIKIWVLTGDKQETAISIGFSCSLLTEDMQQIVVNAPTKENCIAKLRAAAEKYGLGEDDAPKKMKRKFGWKTRSKVTKGSEVARSKPLALIIDGNSLVHALSPEVENHLYDVAVACKVVICCRVAPLQKAGIVSLVKRKTRAMTLAIGDGANDVSMIQTADVGIGLSGQEGRQAVMASDFAMGQFRFLKRLLLIHGHWNYQRLAYMVLYNLYRNAVFVMMLFWYILHTAFSAQTALFDWNLMFYSLVYTSVPTIVVGIMDKDLSQRTLARFPPLYGVGQRGESYNSVLFWATMLDTLWQSLVLFYVPFFAFQGTTIDIWSMGCLWTAAVVILVNLHLAMDVEHWTWITHLAIWGSIVVSFACFLVLDSLVDEGFIAHYRVVFHIASEGAFWLNILLIVVAGLLPRLCAKALTQKFWPSDIHIAREIESKDHPSVADLASSSGLLSVELDDVLQLQKERNFSRR